MRTWQLSHMQFSHRPGYRPQHESAKTKKLTVNRGGQRPRKRPIKGRSTRKRSIENTSGPDCYTDEKLNNDVLMSYSYSCDIFLCSSDLQYADI